MEFSFPNVGVEPSYHSGVEHGGLFNRDQCRQLAKKIIEAYDGNGDGVVESIQVAKWLCDCYRGMNKQFQPTATDIASYVHVIDINRNGKITYQELEEFIVKHFANGAN